MQKNNDTLSILRATDINSTTTRQAGKATAKRALDYINRLKAENAKLKAVDNRVAFCNAYDHLQADYKRIVKEKKQIRKDTAKEILERLLKWKSSVIFDTESVLTAEKNFEDCIKALAVEEYGVEVDDEAQTLNEK